MPTQSVVPAAASLALDGGTSGAPGSQDPPAVGPAPWTRIAAVCLLAGQLLGLVGYSTLEWRRFALTKDFAIYAQAWWEIGHGHLNPFSSVLGLPYWRNNGEFIMWLLALPGLVASQPVVLLWVQDAFIVAAGGVSLRWAAAVIDRAGTRRREASLVFSAATVAVVAGPWAWQTAAFDFHSQAIAAVFVALLGYDLWQARARSLVWLPLALASSAAVAPVVLAVGMASALTVRRGRWRALVSALAAIVWLLLITDLDGAGQGGRGVAHWYGYLVGPQPHHVGLLAIAAGALTHPAAILHLVGRRWPQAAAFLGAVGIVGVLSPWGALPAAGVMLPAILAADPAFFRVAQSFQVWPALPLLLVATVMVLCRPERSPRGERRFAAAVVACWALLGLALWRLEAPLLVAWPRVSPPAAGVLAATLHTIPSGAEVIADNGVMGRFALRTDLRPAGGGPVPVDRRTVVVVLAAGEGIDDPSPREVRQAVGLLERDGAVVQRQASGISVLLWHPAATVRTVSLP